MFKFFNKTRKIALTESRFGKYLSYAMGEIILVVIGILIALQINAYYQNLVQIKKTNTYLSALEEEIQLNTKYIAEHVVRIRKDLIEGANTLTQLNSEEANSFSEDKIKSINVTRPIYETMWAKSTFDDLINSGTLAYIVDDTLKAKILKIEAYRIRALDNFEKAEDVWVNHHKPYLMKHSSVATNWDAINGVDMPKLRFKRDREAFVNNRDFSNIVAVRMKMMGNYEVSLLEMKDFLIELSDDINEHLKKAN